MNPESLQSNQRDIVLRADRDWSELSLRSNCIAETLDLNGQVLPQSRTERGAVLSIVSDCSCLPWLAKFYTLILPVDIMDPTQSDLSAAPERS
jgi:hypothetical protein